MTYKIGFIFGSHNHIPYGTGHDEFERIYTNKLKPFISTLYHYPDIPAALHYSGVLLYWIERNHPEFFMIILDLISRKQIELLGGGFYEPMMTLLPLADKIGQIEMLTTYIRKQFGKRPQGCWLSGSAWEQSMAGVLNTCGMGYTFLEDALFNRAGIQDRDALWPCISEDQGKLVTVFPLSGRLQAELRHKKAAPVLETFFKEFFPDGKQLVSVFPELIFTGTEDPKNYEAALHQFFEALSRAMETSIELTLPTRFLKTHQDLEKAYFPSSASRQFLITYPESNGIYSKMMFTHILINQLRGDKSRKRNAREELWKAQGYNAYDHAGNGGIYCNTLRNAAYKALLEAEKTTREQGTFIPSLMIFDFDLDGEAEYLFQDRNINYYIKTNGAGIFELDYLPKAWNYLATFARRREPYMEESSIEDGYRREAFLDRLVPPDFTLRDALENRFAGSRFCGSEKYQVSEIDKAQKKACFRLLPREDLSFGTVEMEKRYHLNMDLLTLNYSLINRGPKPEDFKFIPQADFSFPGDGETRLRILTVTAGEKKAGSPDCREFNHITGIEFQDLQNETIVSLLSSRPVDLWLIPIHTRCRINEKMRDQYQSTCIMPVQAVSLGPGERFETEFRLRIYH
ncbi:DUF1926 domain-containing protein [Treponema sp. TIM-1]|uniref:alpha-amylase/4-alpha-glucanotransferase domain-containing protein n=1 Tax=Treponema sp. TIM-1 TaxID=2898417 RepID=UPI00397F2213